MAAHTRGATCVKGVGGSRSKRGECSHRRSHHVPGQCVYALNAHPYTCEMRMHMYTAVRNMRVDAQQRRGAARPNAMLEPANCPARGRLNWNSIEYCGLTHYSLTTHSRVTISFPPSQPVQFTDPVSCRVLDFENTSPTCVSCECDQCVPFVPGGV